ncbi:thiamine-phosphate diphosphorylase [Prevotella amnii]|uniref:Thiamine-phosphate synthase n=1 Tax=Prevotella amnii TaxID=419005 RepID=A0A134B590_9BACT|nr:thiamine phosphate synthase [Prevotella amnii]KXB75063.1 thiamine-phosphate diphosphorylase [Prevotella amnii]
MKYLQFITHKNKRFGYLEGAMLALKGGCKWVQLRMKEASDSDFLSLGKKISTLCKAYGATFIVDDRVEMVKYLNADGVHLGKNDMPIEEARSILSSDKIIIGGTANTFDDIKKLYKEGVNYIGCGPFRYTQTKEQLAPILGIEGYKKLLREMKEENINLPIIAIGGIQRSDIAELSEIGLDGIAISSTILCADNPIKEMKSIIQLI